MRIHAAVLALALVGCSSGTAPLDEVELVFETTPAREVTASDTVEFTRLPYGTAEWDARSFEALPAQGSISVFGAWAGGCNPAGSIDRTATALVVRVQSDPLDRTCPSEARPWNYHARLTRVPPGEHTIMVEHENDEWHLEGGVVYEAHVTVQ